MENRRHIWLWSIASFLALMNVLFAPPTVTAALVLDESGHGHNGTTGAGFATATSPTINANFISFMRSTDTILLAGDVSFSTQATYEAIVRFSATTYSTGEGGIWDSWQSGAQDSRLSICNPGAVLG